MAKVSIPKVRQKRFNELRGTTEEVEVEDRPYRIIENEFDELKGHPVDRKVFLTDYEILEAGGIREFFDANDKRIDGMWPYTGERVRKAPAKKKTKKKVSKKKTR